MDEHKKTAYRFLLYQAMLQIRPIRWFGYKWQDLLNPLYLRDLWTSIQGAGALSDWLHNLAFYSCNDFKGFDEDRFWGEMEYFDRSFPNYGFRRYRDLFNRKVGELDSSK